MSTCSKATEHLGIELRHSKAFLHSPQFLHLQGTAGGVGAQGPRSHHLGNLCVTELGALQQGQLCSASLNIDVLMRCYKFLCLELQKSPCYCTQNKPQVAAEPQKWFFFHQQKSSGRCELVPNPMKPALHTLAAPRPCRTSLRAESFSKGMKPQEAWSQPSSLLHGKVQRQRTLMKLLCSPISLGHIFVSGNWCFWHNLRQPSYIWKGNKVLSLLLSLHPDILMQRDETMGLGERLLSFPVFPKALFKKAA